MKPICVPCQRFFRPKKNGVVFTESMPAVELAVPGTAAPEHWKPYKVWQGDLWECQGCGTRIISGVGFESWAERHHSNFADNLARSEFTVNDC